MAIPYQNTTEILLGHQYSVIIKRILTYRCFLGQWAFSLANVMSSAPPPPKLEISYSILIFRNILLPLHDVSLLPVELKGKTLQWKP